MKCFVTTVDHVGFGVKIHLFGVLGDKLDMSNPNSSFLAFSKHHDMTSGHV